MRYVRARDILPAEVLELIQRYVDGEYIYIPRKGEQRAWGEKSLCRQELARRNAEIFRAHREGMTPEELAGAYFLSEKSIRRILREEKARNSIG